MQPAAQWMFPPKISTMRIERIENSKHKQERVLVFLQGGSLLRITPAELLRFGLQTGMDISPETVVELEKSAARSEMKVRGAQLTGGRMLSKKQVVEHLARRGGDREAAEETADWLEELGAVDEEAYAAAIARHYSRSGYGAGRVRQEFVRRGVPRELWEDALALLGDSEEAIERFIRTRAKGKALDKDLQRKVAAALQRRGFGWEEIRPVLNRWGGETEE